MDLDCEWGPRMHATVCEASVFIDRQDMLYEGAPAKYPKPLALIVKEGQGLLVAVDAECLPLVLASDSDRKLHRGFKLSTCAFNRFRS